MSTVPNNPYAPGKCWYRIKVSKYDTVTCGLDARLYYMTRNNELGRRMNTTSMQVWACDNHRISLTNDGFTLTLTKET